MLTVMVCLVWSGNISTRSPFLRRYSVMPSTEVTRSTPAGGAAAGAWRRGTGQKLPVARLRVEAARALDHDGQEFGPRFVQCPELFANDDRAGGKLRGPPAHNRLARRVVGVDHAERLRAVLVRVLLTSRRRGVAVDDCALEQNPRLPVGAYDLGRADDALGDGPRVSTGRRRAP